MSGQSARKSKRLPKSNTSAAHKAWASKRMGKGSLNGYDKIKAFIWVPVKLSLGYLKNYAMKSKKIR